VRRESGSPASAATWLALGAAAVLLPGFLAAGAGAEPDRQPVRHYVALGDSYVSKPGLRGIDPEEPTCGRTDENYPAAVAAGLGLEPSDGFTDVGCAASKTTALANERDSIGQTIPPQLDSVTEDTDLVTISIGENNLDFFSTTLSTCIPIDLMERDGSPCKREGPIEQPVMSEQGFAQVRESARRDLSNAARVIKDRAPQARIFFVGYPQMFPIGTQCLDTALMTPGDMAWIDHRLEGVNATIQQVAKESGQTYIDVYTPSVGHGMCSAGPAWEAGLLTPNLLESQPLHLTPLGAQEIARLILAKV
jgi:lysophospholipase L1-like esterase